MDKRAETFPSPRADFDRHLDESTRAASTRQKAGDAADLDASFDGACASEDFSVHDAASANWLVRKILESRAYVQRVASWAEAETRRAKGKEQWLMDRFGHQLRAWACAELIQERNRRKCIALPAGTIGFRTAPTRLQINDEQALIAWSKVHAADAVKTTLEIAGKDAERLAQLLRNEDLQVVVHDQLIHAVLREHFQTTGELPAGASLGGGGEMFYIK